MGQTRKRHDTATFKPHVKKGDEVLVLAGRSVDDRGRIVSVDPQRERAIVEGVNIVTKHQKPQGGQGMVAQQQGGRIERPATIYVSNLMVICPSCNQPGRLRHKQVEGKWVRSCRRCGEPVERPRS